MKCNDQNRSCHPERSEGSISIGYEILRCAQDDITLPILMGKVHYRGLLPRDSQPDEHSDRPSFRRGNDHPRDVESWLQVSCIRRKRQRR
jgi:hypothetical protein